MSKDDIINDSQRYLDEMMRFYSQNKNASVNTRKDNEETVINENETTANQEEANENETAINQEEANENVMAVNQEKANENETTVNQEEANETIENGYEVSTADNYDESPEPGNLRYTAVELPPIPVIPDNIISDKAENQTESPVNSEYGFLKVEVRTGRNGFPVPGAAITVSEKNGIGENIIFSGITDESGGVETIKLPAPKNSKGSEPSTFSSYAVYTVSAYVKGFYRSVSADVPIFAGITSIQRFDLIPLPYDYDDSGQSIVNENTEPNMP